MVKVKYLREVETPERLAGKVGDVKEMSMNDAAYLAGEGYVEIIGESNESGVDG